MPADDEAEVLRRLAHVARLAEHQEVLPNLLPVLDRLWAAVEVLRAVDVDDVEMALGFRAASAEPARD